MSVQKAQCLCQSVSCEYTSPSLWSAHCHCRLCQRSHGAAFVTWVGVDSGKVTIEGGDRLCWYASSEDSERGFCQRCGSTLFFRSDRWPGELHIARANFITELDIKPKLHAYWETHVGWLDIKDSLPKKHS